MWGETLKSFPHHPKGRENVLFSDVLAFVYFLFVFEHEVKWKLLSCVQLFTTPCMWNSPGQYTGVGSLSLLQGIFSTRGSSPGLPHCRWILYQLSLKGSPRILEWVAYPFLQQIFQTQESNQAILHCRWILNQWSYLGSSFLTWRCTSNI